MKKQGHQPSCSAHAGFDLGDLGYVLSPLLALLFLFVLPVILTGPLLSWEGAIRSCSPAIMSALFIFGPGMNPSPRKLAKLQHRLEELGYRDVTRAQARALWMTFGRAVFLFPAAWELDPKNPKYVRPIKELWSGIAWHQKRSVASFLWPVIFLMPACMLLTLIPEIWPYYVFAALLIGLLSCPIWYVRSRLIRNGHHWITFADTIRLIVLLGRRSFRLPPNDELAVIPGWREYDPESFRRILEQG